MKIGQSAPTPIRLSFELKLWIRARAKANMRSMNGEIVTMLSKAWFKKGLFWVTQAS